MFLTASELDLAELGVTSSTARAVLLRLAAYLRDDTLPPPSKPRFGISCARYYYPFVVHFLVTCIRYVSVYVSRPLGVLCCRCTGTNAMWRIRVQSARFIVRTSFFCCLLTRCCRWSGYQRTPANGQSHQGQAPAGGGGHDDNGGSSSSDDDKKEGTSPSSSSPDDEHDHDATSEQPVTLELTPPTARTVIPYAFSTERPVGPAMKQLVREAMDVLEREAPVLWFVEEAPEPGADVEAESLYHTTVHTECFDDQVIVSSV